MKKALLTISIALLLMTLPMQAQESNTRYKKQHIKQITQNLVLALKNNDSPSMQASAAQTIRQLEWTFPEEPFESLVDPLILIVKDEKAETSARLLAALALDGIHSDTGDNAIENAAANSGNKSMKDLCSALLIKTGR